MNYRLVADCQSVDRCGLFCYVYLQGMEKVRVIEDDETVRDVLRSFLLEKGYEVTIAHKGETGLEMVRGD